MGQEADGWVLTQSQQSVFHEETEGVQNAKKDYDYDSASIYVDPCKPQVTSSLGLRNEGLDGTVDAKHWTREDPQLNDISQAYRCSFFFVLHESSNKYVEEHLRENTGACNKVWYRQLDKLYCHVLG